MTVPTLRFEPLMVSVEPTAPKAGEKPMICGARITWKLFALWFVPPDATTLIGPAVAPGGTAAVIVVVFTTVNAAVALLKNTMDAPSGKDPVSVTTVPIGPLVGVKLVKTGGTKKVPLVTEPAGAARPRGPVVARAGTTAVTVVLLTFVNTAAAWLKYTAVVFVRFCPVIVIFVPGKARMGEKLVIVGGR
jgi:hypothetical protein